MPKGSARRQRQKERTVFESQIQPSLDASEAAYKAFVELEQVIDPHRLARKEKVLRLQGRLLDHSTKKKAGSLLKQLKADTAASRPPTGYYVIVGRGAAAVVNHSTLFQCQEGRERIGGLPVLHVGFADPWLHYHEHGMGQPPYLLGMPGYRKPVRADAKTIRSGLSSRVFAESTLAELELLQKEHEVYVVEGWVPLIESRANRRGAAKGGLVALGLDDAQLTTILGKDFKPGYPPYRLLVVSPRKELYFVYAEKIDLCIGAGRMRVALDVENDLLAAARTEPWLPPYEWSQDIKQRKVVHGMDGLTEQTPWKRRSRVCIYGSGGIGMNQIERAEDDDSVFADWLPRNTLHDTFALRRNDTVLMHPDEDRPMNPGENDACRTGPGVMDNTVHLYPARVPWRFGKNSEVGEVAANNGRVEVKVKNKADSKVGYSTRDYSDLTGTSFPYKGDYPHAIARPELYDLVILCNGQVQNVTGEPSKVAEGFPVTPIPIDGRMVGAQAEGGNIRILGAGAAMFPGLAGTGPGIAMETYRQSLPVSSVPPGFILAASNIGYANGFFDDPDHPNTNVNTIPRARLKELLETEGGLQDAEAGVVAGQIVDCRKWPNNGIPDVDTLKSRLKALRVEDDLSEEIETALKVLRYSY